MNRRKASNCSYSDAGKVIKIRLFFFFCSPFKYDQMYDLPISRRLFCIYIVSLVEEEESSVNYILLWHIYLKWEIGTFSLN